MKLSEDQIHFYHEKGYLILDSVFTPEEVEKMYSASQNFYDKLELPNVICEESGEIRSVFAPDKHEEVFDWLYRQDRIVGPVQQMLRTETYLYQFKLNNKKALKGEWWEWHQDFPYWNIDDGVQKPQMLSVMVLFQDTESYQGPLMFIPGSHRDGVVEFEPKPHLEDGNQGGDENVLNSLSADLKYTVKKQLLQKLLAEQSAVAAEGKAGTCIFFDANLLHASNSNLSPFDRNTGILTYNSVENLPTKGTSRPEYLCSRDFTPIVAQPSNMLSV
jgi:ectoine hydroxylase